MVVILLISGCFVALFLEVQDLKSKTSSFERVPVLLMQQINESIKSEVEALSSLQSEKLEQLNTSIVDSSSNIKNEIEELSSFQSENLQQLNTSIVDVKESLSSYDSRMQELNVSIDLGLLVLLIV